MNSNPTIRIVPEPLHSSLKLMFQWHNEVKKLLRVRFSLFYTPCYSNVNFGDCFFLSLKNNNSNEALPFDTFHQNIVAVSMCCMLTGLPVKIGCNTLSSWAFNKSENYGTDLSAKHMTQFKTQCYKEKGYSWLYTMGIK